MRYLVSTFAIAAVALLAVTVVAQEPSHAPGVFLQVPGKTGPESEVRMHSQIARDMKQKGLLKSMATGGHLGTDTYGTIPGAAASLRVPSGDVAFDLHVNTNTTSNNPDSLPMDPSSLMGKSREDMMDSMSDNMPPGMKSEQDVYLIRLKPAKDAREAHLGHGDKRPGDALKLTGQRLGPDWYRVRPAEPLAPGEYALVAASQQSGSGAQLWAFGVDK